MAKRVGWRKAGMAEAGGEKPPLRGVVEAVKAKWRESEVRKAMREATEMDDAGIERALAQPETEQALGEYAQVMLREALVPVLEGAIARAVKETSGAKAFFELAEAARLVGLKREEGPTAEQEVTAFERAILGNLRELLRNEEQVTSD
ncbi:MAG: hypothetical protein ACRD5F_03965 [Candidatus Acidiferrales bacterium]